MIMCTSWKHLCPSQRGLLKILREQWRHSGLMVGVFLGKTLYCHSTSLHPGVYRLSQAYKPSSCYWSMPAIYAASHVAMKFSFSMHAFHSFPIVIVVLCLVALQVLQASYWGELALQPCERHQLDSGGWESFTPLVELSFSLQSSTAWKIQDGGRTLRCERSHKKISPALQATLQATGVPL